jgi:hypothetical protein
MCVRTFGEILTELRRRLLTGLDKGWHKKKLQRRETIPSVMMNMRLR